MIRSRAGPNSSPPPDPGCPQPQQPGKTSNLQDISRRPSFAAAAARRAAVRCLGGFEAEKFYWIGGGESDGDLAGVGDGGVVDVRPGVGKREVGARLEVE